jgi:hypothetical protein
VTTFMYTRLSTAALCFVPSGCCCACAVLKTTLLSAVASGAQASTFAGGITVLRNMATQGRPIVTVSVALFARNDLALGQLAPTASIVEDALSVTISAPDSYERSIHL